MRSTETLRELRAWIKFKLEYGPIKSIQPDDAGGPYNQHPSGYAAVLVPDWEMRQKLEMIEESLSKECGPHSAAGKPEDSSGS